MKPRLPSRSHIEQTIAYTDFFHSRLNFSQLHHWLISPHTFTQSQLRQSLSRFPKLKKKLSHSPSISPSQKKLYQQKITTIQPFLRLLSFFPTIRLVALTGSLAVYHSTPEDDIDLLIITSPHTLWLTRLLLFPFLLFFNRRRPHQPYQPDALCLNLWLDTSQLTLTPSKQNLYTAHELLQIKPLLDRGQTYPRLLKANSWVSNYLANAYHTTINSLIQKLRPTPSLSFLLFPFNFLSFLGQRLYMSSKITNETITLSQAYFHPQDFSASISSHLGLS